jgi:hypothetical protein
MVDLLYVEFLFGNGRLGERARDVWNSFESDSGRIVSHPPDDEFPDGGEFAIAVEREEREFWGDIRPSTSTEDGLPAEVPALELVKTTDILRSATEEARTRMVEELLDGVKAVYDSLGIRPDYVYGLDPNQATMVETGRFGPPVSDSDFDEGDIQYASWLMLFPPAMVEEYGRQFLLDAPAWRTEELDGGAVLVVATDHPEPPDPTPLLEALERLHDYLGLPLDRLPGI